VGRSDLVLQDRFDRARLAHLVELLDLLSHVRGGRHVVDLDAGLVESN
jgi:hypothetical protein